MQWIIGVNDSHPSVRTKPGGGSARVRTSEGLEGLEGPELGEYQAQPLVWGLARGIPTILLTAADGVSLDPRNQEYFCQIDTSVIYASSSIAHSS